MGKKKKLMALLALLTLIPAVSFADDADHTSAAVVIPDSSGKIEHATRARELDAAGDYPGALAELRLSCDYEADGDFAALCMAEVREYAQKYGLPQPE